MVSNTDTDWGKCYDCYETEFREVYKTQAEPQNKSHFLLINKYYNKGLFSKDFIFGEIGFGAGLTLRMASNLFSEVWGLDISAKNIKITEKELLQEGIQNITLKKCDILKFDEKLINKFDIISFIHGLEHFSSNDYPKFFNNLKQYIKKDGYFTGALPYNLTFKYRMCPKCGEIFEIDGHLSKHNLVTIKDLFITNGFKIIYLNNFNLYYYLAKEKNLIKKILKIIYFFLKKPTFQIEFIIQNI